MGRSMNDSICLRTVNMDRSLLVMCMLCSIGFALDTEPLCLSKYDYDYKMLKNLVSLEQEQKELKQQLDKQSTAFLEQEQTIRRQEVVIEKLQASQTESAQVLEEISASLPGGSGSTYVRWGRTSCPGNGTTLVYAGYAAGSHFNVKGAAANDLCLPREPLWGDYDDAVNNGAPVYGTEYEFSKAYSEKLFKKNLLQQEAPCAVCRSVRSSALMIPARNACYDGWTKEFSGYLVAGHPSHDSASEFNCLDIGAEVVPGFSANDNPNLWYIAEATCNSLSCPPYVNGRELTCVLCTL